MWWIQSLGNARVCLCIYDLILSIFSNSWSFYLEVCKEKGRGGDNQTVFDQESLGVLQ